MSGHEIELTIERIVLHDLPAVPRHRLLAAIEDALQRLVSESGLPADMAVDAITVPAASVQIEPGASVETMAGQIARSVYASLRPATGGLQSGNTMPLGIRQPGAEGWSQPAEGNHA
jgi:hypothetical protein